MKDIIINQPHLQSFRQKCASLFLSLASWLLWLYFLLPLFTLGGWLLGVKSLSDEIRWFGGYKTLQDLLLLYGAIILFIGACWSAWTFYLSWLHAGWPPKSVPKVDDRQLCAEFGLDGEQLKKAKSGQKVTVHFDEHAQIIAIDCGASHLPSGG